jgi:hypothetical protein
MTGSQATAGLRGGAMRDSGQHSNNELTRLGPASARRPGPQQGEGFGAHLALRTRRRGGGDEQRNGPEQRKQGGAVHGFTSTSPLYSSPAPWRLGEAANSSVKRRQAVRLGEGATWPAPALQPLHERFPVQQLRLQAGGEAAVQRGGDLGLLHERHPQRLQLLPASPLLSSLNRDSGRRLTPAGCQGLGAGAAALASSIPPSSSTPPASPSLPLPLLLAVDREDSHGAVA